MNRTQQFEELVPLIEKSKRFFGDLTQTTFLELAQSESLALAFKYDYILSYINKRATTRTTSQRKKNLQKILDEESIHTHLEDHLLELSEDYFCYPDELDNESTTAQAGELEVFSEEEIIVTSDHDTNEIDCED